MIVNLFQKYKHDDVWSLIQLAKIKFNLSKILWSRFELTHWFEGLVSSFKSKGFFHHIGKELSILCEISIAFDSCTASELRNLEAVVTTITGAYTEKTTSKKTIFEALKTSLHGLTCFAEFTVDEEGSTEGPTAWVTVEVGQLYSLKAVPSVDALSHTTGLVRTAKALANFLKTGWFCHS